MDVPAKKEGSICIPIVRGASNLAATQLLIRLPDALVRRFKHNVSVRQRSRFIQRLLEDALPPEDGSDDDPLYQAVLSVEKEHELTTEMAEWEVANDRRRAQRWWPIEEAPVRRGMAPAAGESTVRRAISGG